MHIPHPVDVAAYRQRQVTCSLRSEEQTISTTLAYIDSVDKSGRSVPGFQDKVQLWTMSTQQSHMNPRTGASELSTVVKWFTTVTPVALRGVYALRWDKDSIQTVMIPTWDRQMSTRLQQIENFLVDHEALQHP